MFLFEKKKGKKGVPQSQDAAFPRHQEEEETDKIKFVQIDLAKECAQYWLTA